MFGVLNTVQRMERIVINVKAFSKVCAHNNRDVKQVHSSSFTGDQSSADRSDDAIRKIEKYLL